MEGGNQRAVLRSSRRTVRDEAAGLRRRVFAGHGTLERRGSFCAVGGAIFGNQFQSRLFVGTSTDA